MIYAPAYPKYLHPCRQCRERARLQDVIGRVESGTETEESEATMFKGGCQERQSRKSELSEQSKSKATYLKSKTNTNS